VNRSDSAPRGPIRSRTGQSPSTVEYQDGYQHAKCDRVSWTDTLVSLADLQFAGVMALSRTLSATPIYAVTYRRRASCAISKDEASEILYGTNQRSHSDAARCQRDH